MRDRVVISAGLAAFLALATFPLWYNSITGTSGRPPALAQVSVRAIWRVQGIQHPKEGHELPSICVAPRDFMRASHMQLLVSWRDDVVRGGDRLFAGYDGRRYEKNLTATCLGCHEDKAKFCDRCHDYAGVSPQCPVCHQAPRGDNR